MIGNVQILYNSGRSLVSNGLAHFIVNESQKQYIIYTFGEQPGENLKVHIGLENAPVTEPGITKTDGDFLSELLRRIGRNEDVSSELTFLPLTSGLYYVNDGVKRVAIPNQISNNLIALQQQSQIKNTQENAPVIQENAFFDSSMATEPQSEASQQVEQSIFSQPMQPIIENSYGGEKVTNQTIANSESDNGGTTLISPKEPELANEELITDEQAKSAINTVEEAQRTIAENVKLIKLYIRQQKTLANKISSEATLAQSESSLETFTAPTPEVEKTNETPDPQERRDTVNNIELAPQPVASLDVLGEESELRNDYVLDTSSQIGTENNGGSLEVASDTIANNFTVSLEPTPTIQEENYEQQYVDMNRQLEEQPMEEVKYIDTTAMMQQPQVLENQYFNQNMDASQASMIDTGIQRESQEYVTQKMETVPEPVTIDTGVAGQANQSVEAAPELDTSYYQNQINNGQQNFGYATQMPSLEVQNTTQQFVGVDNISEQENNQYMASNASQPEYAEKIVQFPTSESPMINNNEVSLPPVDIVSEVAPVSDVAPVVLPDGQTAEVGQSLVLTPEAFSQAA